MKGHIFFISIFLPTVPFTLYISNLPSIFVRVYVEGEQIIDT